MTQAGVGSTLAHTTLSLSAFSIRSVLAFLAHKLVKRRIQPHSTTMASTREQRKKLANELVAGAKVSRNGTGIVIDSDDDPRRKEVDNETMRLVVAALVAKFGVDEIRSLEIAYFPNVTKIPSNIVLFKNLEKLNFSYFLHLDSLLDEIRELKKLRELVLASCGFRKVPAVLKDVRLDVLDLPENFIEVVPGWLLTVARKINVSSNVLVNGQYDYSNPLVALRKVESPSDPEETVVEELDLSGNYLKAFPSFLGELETLREVNAEFNAFNCECEQPLERVGRLVHAGDGVYIASSKRTQ